VPIVLLFFFPPVPLAIVFQLFSLKFDEFSLHFDDAEETRKDPIAEPVLPSRSIFGVIINFAIFVFGVSPLFFYSCDVNQN
jgi:hypothetical protein